MKHVPYLSPSVGALLTQEVLNGTGWVDEGRGGFQCCQAKLVINHHIKHTHNTHHHADYMHNNRAGERDIAG